MSQVDSTTASTAAGTVASTAPGRAGVVVVLLALVGLLGGCDAIYDDTKGWANRLEASILEAAHDLEEDPEAEAPAHYTPEVVETPRAPRAGSATTPAMSPIPASPPQGLAGLSAAPAPAASESDSAVVEAVETLLAPKPAADEAGKQSTEAKSSKDGSATKPAESDVKAAKKSTPPLPKRKPAPQMAAAKETADKAATEGKTAPKQAAKEAEPAKEAAKSADPVAMVLHLSSLRSEEAAKREWRTLKRDFPVPLNALEAEIRRTELGDKGTFYRVLAGPLRSRTEAQEACDAVKARNVKQYCRVLPSRPADKSPS